MLKKCWTLFQKSSRTAGIGAAHNTLHRFVVSGQRGEGQVVVRLHRQADAAAQSRRTDRAAPQRVRIPLHAAPHHARPQRTRAAAEGRQGQTAILLRHV
jgi:hypothetical protein